MSIFYLKIISVWILRRGPKSTNIKISKKGGDSGEKTEDRESSVLLAEVEEKERGRVGRELRGV